MCYILWIVYIQSKRMNKKEKKKQIEKKNKTMMMCTRKNKRKIVLMCASVFMCTEGVWELNI